MTPPTPVLAFTAAIAVFSVVSSVTSGGVTPTGSASARLGGSGGKHSGGVGPGGEGHTPAGGHSAGRWRSARLRTRRKSRPSRSARLVAMPCMFANRAYRISLRTSYFRVTEAGSRGYRVHPRGCSGHLSTTALNWLSHSLVNVLLDAGSPPPSHCRHGPQ